MGLVGILGDLGARISRTSSGSISRLRANQPAQQPDAHLFGDGGDGLRCQFSGGAKAYGLRTIIGLFDQLDKGAMSGVLLCSSRLASTAIERRRSPRPTQAAATG
ncbi:MAG TPA: hypothetical protein DDY14_16145 [Chromatiaceae bacterium]|nr:MAG: hypothetical protein N838_14015 [Thiohalocapsa sp. PB-PSB1]HBG96814.1 hypothetical protein [Chromatiaceae bacterium]HCS88586.1 hypothetical protein [Chromatiaceae bacterium]